MMIAGWIAIGLEIVLLLIWVYSVFFSRNRTDPAGKGIAQLFLIGLSAYIGLGIWFMLLERRWSVIMVLVMAAIPLAIVAIGLYKEYGSGKKEPNY